MTGPTSPLARSVAVILLLSAIFLFFNLGAYSLKEPDEGRYAEIPREMVESGDWLVPHFDYVRYFEKPPLLYWATALSFRAFGVNEWAFRLPNALFALLCVLSLYLFARRPFGEVTAFLSAIILMSAFGFFAMGRVVTTDMLFTFLLCLSLLSFDSFYRTGRRRQLCLFYISLGLATLTKGPVAILLMGATIVPFLLAEGRLRFIKELRLFWGIPLFLAVAAPWFIAISLKEGEFFSFFFVDQHLMRFLTTRHKRTGPVYYFIPVVLGGLFPWSLFIPRAVVQAWRRSEMRLFFIWSLVVFVFFSLSRSKLPPYVLPLFPSVSLIIAAFVQARWSMPPPRAEKAIYGILFALCATGTFFAGSGLLPFSLTKGLPAADTARVALILSGISLAAAALFLWPSRKLPHLFIGLTLFSGATVATLTVHPDLLDAINASKGLALTINGYGSEVRSVVNYGSLEESLPFYLRRRIYVAGYTGELKMGSLYADAAPYFLDEKQLVALVRSQQGVFIVIKEKRLGRLRELGLDLRLIECRNEKCLLRN